MANVRAFRSGLWSDTNPTTSPWGTGGVLYAPAANDIVYANSHTIHVDQNINVVIITNAASAVQDWKDGGSVAATNGGTFNILNGITVVGNINFGQSPPRVPATTTTAVLTGSNSATIQGSIIGGSNYAVGLRVSTSGNAEVIGDIYGGNNTSAQNGTGITFSSSSGNLTVTGNIFGGERGSGVVGDGANSGISSNSSTGSITVYGNVFGPAGDAGTNDGITLINTSTGSLTVYGNVQAGNLITQCNGIRNASTGTVNLFGNLTGATAICINNVSTGRVNIIGNLIADARGGAGLAATNAAAPINISGNIINAPNGVAAVYAASFRYDPVPQDSYIRYARNGTGLGDDAYLYQVTQGQLAQFSAPPLSSVRTGTAYSLGTGTCHIPAPSAVAYGTVYDSNESKFGLAINRDNVIFNTLINNLSVVNSLGDRVKRSVTTESTGHLIASFSN